MFEFFGKGGRVRVFLGGGGILWEKTNETIYLRSDQLIKCGVKIIIYFGEREDRKKCSPPPPSPGK